MSNYYFIMSGLPDLQLESPTAAFSTRELREQLLEQEIKRREELLKKLAVEYTLLGKECEQEQMTDAAIRNYEKALELYPDAPEARRRLKRLKR